MSTYSRTRKAICRVSKLNTDTWLVNRVMFRKNKPKTWKQSYKAFRKNMIMFYGKSPIFKDMYGENIKLPSQYKVALEHFLIWYLIRN